MSLSPPPSKQAKQDCPIDKLADAELSEIFKRLPPYERLLASEVCRRWHAISRMPWCDVAGIDLRPIPGQNIRSIVKQCPNLRSAFAFHKVFGLDELLVLREAPRLSCVKLYDCTFAALRHDPRMVFSYDFIPKIFFENLQHAPWNELVLHNERIGEVTPSEAGSNSFIFFRFDAASLPASLTRLQLSRGRHGKFDSSLERLENLECLILSQDYLIAVNGSGLKDLITRHTVNIAALHNLREICLGGLGVRPSVLKLLVACLPQLQVLFANGIQLVTIENVVDMLTDVITKPSALRILALTGRVCGDPDLLPEILVPARKRFPNGFGSDPLPLLNIFVSDEVSQWIHFMPSDAAVIYPINASMPDFLERADIAPIFDGVWIAEKIKEAAKYGNGLLRE